MRKVCGLELRPFPAIVERIVVTHHQVQAKQLPAIMGIDIGYVPCCCSVRNVETVQFNAVVQAWYIEGYSKVQRWEVLVGFPNG